MNTPKVVDAVLCEGIRQELSGRFTLIGAFGGDLRIRELPGLILVGVFAEIRVEELGEHTADFRVRDPSQKDLVTAKMRSSLDTLGNSSIAVNPFPLPVEREGIHKWQWRFEGGRWETLKSLNISIDPDIPVPLHGTIAPTSA